MGGSRFVLETGGELTKGDGRPPPKADVDGRKMMGWAIGKGGLVVWWWWW
jgi:hypothetical protein